MSAVPPRSPKREDGPVAYLILREGGKWRDVFRLTPGQVTTVGRAPTNRVVVSDEVCSRNHCEIFLSGAQWTLRDLNSRNGTLVDEEPVNGDHELLDGEILRIGSTLLGFTFNLARQLPDVHDEAPTRQDAETAFDIAIEDLDSGEHEPAIVHRTRKSRFTSLQDLDRDRTGGELATLYRLAMDMGSASDEQALAKIVLDGLFAGTSADIGAILYLPEGTDEPRPRDLTITAYQSRGDLPYQRVSDHLSEAVLDSGEAILARDVSDDSRLANRDTLGQIHAQSVICAPVRESGRAFGLVHLYSTKPHEALDPNDLEFTLAVADQLANAIQHVRQMATLRQGLARAHDENRALRSQLKSNTSIVGESKAIHRLREDIARVAPTDATVLIRGESGVGKELVARAIHFDSDRDDAPIVCMNCAALSESLLESELFGHEKGSFTGATERKIGKFEQADGGTLFLDEVGEMSLGVQAKFLRVLEGHAFERVGGRDPVQVDVRVVAATNRDLESAVREGRFRSDLYFRLQVVEIDVPPLRERANDVPLLAVHFLQRFAEKSNRPVNGFSPEAVRLLTNHNWPGNVRQLQNTVERAVVLSRTATIEASDIQLSSLEMEQSGSRPAEQPEVYRDVSLEELEREHILATLEETGWNKSKSAQILGIERSTLDRKLKRYKVSRPGR